MIVMMESLDELIGFPVMEIVEMAAPLGINVHIVRQFEDGKRKNFKVNKIKGDIYVALEDGKVTEIWLGE